MLLKWQKENVVKHAIFLQTKRDNSVANMTYEITVDLGTMQSKGLDVLHS